MDEEEGEEDEELCTEGSRSPKILGFIESDETKDMADVEV